MARGNDLLGHETVVGHPLVRELADQVVEERFGDTLAGLRCDLARALADNENLTTRLAMVTEHRDRLRTALLGVQDTGIVPADVREMRPRTGLVVVPSPGGIAS